MDCPNPPQFQRFNSTKVRLKALILVVLLQHHNRFNSTKVRLKDYTEPIGSDEEVGFNSTKVRLKAKKK